MSIWTLSSCQVTYYNATIIKSWNHQSFAYQYEGYSVNTLVFRYYNYCDIVINDLTVEP